MADITLRIAGKECADILSRIHEECFINYWNIEAFTDFFSVYNTHAILAEIPPSLTLPRKGGGDKKAEKRGEVVGMAVFRLYPDEAEIVTIAVRPEWRRQGIGRMLLEKAMKEAAGVSLKAMFLDVEAGNEAALKLYESYGFSLVRRRKHYYRQKDGSYTDALVLSRKLA